jgi:hypothetical protein
MARQDEQYLANKRAEKAVKNASLQSFTAGDAKKGAGLFKVSTFLNLSTKHLNTR